MHVQQWKKPPGWGKERQSAGGCTLDPMRSPQVAANSVALQRSTHLYVTPDFEGRSHCALSVMQTTPLPSDPSQSMIVRAARQLSRIGAASIGSKLDDQLQVAGGFVASFVEASPVSVLETFPAHAASQANARRGTIRKKGTLEDYRRRERWARGLRTEGRLDARPHSSHRDLSYPTPGVRMADASLTVMKA